MKKICLFIVLLSSFSFAQQNGNKFSEVKMSTINQKKFENICANIPKIINEYDCNSDINKKSKIKYQNEELVILLRKNKVKLNYNTSQDKGLLYYKFQALLNLINEK